MQGSFDKVFLGYKAINKSAAYSRIQRICCCFRVKKAKSKPILRYRTSPKTFCLFFILLPVPSGIQGRL